MNRYQITLRNSKVFVLTSDNDLHTITDRLAITPATVATAPYWVFDKDVAVRTDDIVAIERMPEKEEEETF